MLRIDDVGEGWIVCMKDFVIEEGRRDFKYVICLL